MAKSRRVAMLRLRRSDAESEHVLVHVVSAHSTALDVELVATDKEDLYRGHCDGSSISSLRASRYTGDDGEWERIMAWVLLHRRSDGALLDVLRGVEAVASIASSTLDITVRRNIGGIVQRLGTIQLQRSDVEINALDWAEDAVAEADSLRAERDALQTSAAEQSEHTSRLNAELDRLIRAKKEGEDELLAKFATLLNAKKLKIREQQRLLTTYAAASSTRDRKRTAREVEDADEDEDEARHRQETPDVDCATDDDMTARRRTTTRQVRPQSQRMELEDDDDDDDDNLRRTQTPPPSSRTNMGDDRHDEDDDEDDGDDDETDDEL